jgi:hypothetical protein
MACSMSSSCEAAVARAKMHTVFQIRPTMLLEKKINVQVARLVLSFIATPRLHSVIVLIVERSVMFTLSN